MKVPKARRLPSGMWFIQLRLGGESIPITTRTEKECIRQAQYAKAEYLAGKRAPKKKEPDTPTLSEAIDHFIEERRNILSPATIRGYRSIQRNRFKSTMQRKIGEITEETWQSIVNQEAALCAHKTLKNAASFVHTVIQTETGKSLPVVKQGVPIPHHTPFLQPEEILPFVDAVIDTKYALAALLALSSMRISEIWALRWEKIPPHPDFIRCDGAMVQGEDNKMQRKEEAKNETSARNVAILIPELRQVIERERRSSGPLTPYSQSAFRNHLHKICRQAKITDVTPHGLRHSFASLCYHLKVPKKLVMELGGWKDDGTMERIYTHIAQNDITRYQSELAAFYKRSH